MEEEIKVEKKKTLTADQLNWAQYSQIINWISEKKSADIYEITNARVEVSFLPLSR